MIKNFHTFVQTNKPEDYKKYVDSTLAATPIALRDLLNSCFLHRDRSPLMKSNLSKTSAAGSRRRECRWAR